MAGRNIASLILTLGFCFPHLAWGQGQWNGPVPAHFEKGNWYDPTAVQPAGHTSLDQDYRSAPYQQGPVGPNPYQQGPVGPNPYQQGAVGPNPYQPVSSSGNPYQPVSANANMYYQEYGGYPMGPAHAPTIQPTHPYSYPGPNQIQNDIPYYSPEGFVTEKVSHPDVWDEERPIERFLTSMVTNTWIRLDYMNWSIEGHGHTVLGAPVELDGRVIDPSETFLIDNPLFGFDTIRVPTLDSITHDNNNGAMITYGIPLTFATIEFDVFTLQKDSDTEVAQDLAFGQIDLIGTSLLDNGQISPDQVINVYDDSFQVRYQTELWGAGAMVVFNPANPNDGFQFRPVAGFRVMGFDDQMTQTGVFVGDGTDPPLVSILDAKAENLYYGLALGFRAELVDEWFTLGIEPRVNLALNSSTSSVTAIDFFAPNDLVTSEIDDLSLAPIFELGLWSTIRLQENLHVRVGYQAIYTTETSRSANIIYYNENNLTPLAADVTVRDKRESVFIHGLNVGLVFTFP